MIKTPLSTMIGGAGIWTPGCTVIGLMQKTLDQLIKSLFANNEQGFTRTPDDLSTMYQDAAGTTSVTAVGQPVALMLDKSKGLVLGTEIVTSFGLSKSAAIIESGSDGILNYSAGILTLQRNATDAVAFLNSSIASLDVNKFYKLKFRVVSGLAVIRDNVNTLSNLTANEYTFIMRSTSSLRFWPQNTGSTVVIDNISVKELAGNHAYQATSSMRPLLQDSPRRIDYDAVDDKLITNLPAQLSGCTVIRAVPNIGTQILTNQTIPTPYNDNTDHCGLIVINRALTATETSQITKLFNKAAGV